MTSTGTRSTCGRRARDGSGCRVGDATVEMTRGDDDWWSPPDPVPDLTAEVDYGYLIDDADTPRPDPRSRRQPAGVHQRSRTFDPTRLRVERPRAGPAASSRGAVVYELHVGTFTPEGTFDAALGRLDHLRSTSASTSSS